MTPPPELPSGILEANIYFCKKRKIIKIRNHGREE
jgi:hypothetical protein